MGNGGSSNGPAYQTREYKDLSRSGKKIYDNETTDDFDRNILLTLNTAGCNIYFNLNAREKTAFKSLDRDNRIHFLKMSDSLRTIFFDMETDGEKAFLLRNYSIDVGEFDRRLERYRSSVQFKETTNGIRETFEDLRRRINGTENDVNTLQTDMTDVKNDVNTLQTDMTDVKSNVRGLTIRTDNLRNNVNDVQTRTTNLERNVNTLQTDMTNVRNDVNTLQTDMTNVQNNVNDVQTRTTNLEHNANTQNNRLNRVTEEINNIKKEQEEDRRAREEERRENEDIVNFLQERFHYKMKKVNELSSSTSSTSSEIPLQEIETEHSEIL